MGDESFVVVCAMLGMNTMCSTCVPVIILA